MIRDLFGILIIVSVNVKCDKPCDVDEYLDYENCKCRQKILDNLVAECSENIYEVKIAKKTSTELHSVWHENVCVCS